MGNMSYCRFHNTLGDLEDCRDQLINYSCLTEKDEYDEYLSRTEFVRAKELIEMCREIAENFEDVDLDEIENKGDRL